MFVCMMYFCQNYRKKITSEKLISIFINVTLIFNVVFIMLWYYLPGHS